MKREEIIRMAREAGAFIELSTTPEKDIAFLERFAALLAAAEREECAKLCENEFQDPCDGALMAEMIRARSQA